MESIPWVRCASGNVFPLPNFVPTVCLVFAAFPYVKSIFPQFESHPSMWDNLLISTAGDVNIFHQKESDVEINNIFEYLFVNNVYIWKYIC